VSTCATGCGRPAPTAVICPACTTRLERTLAELPNDLRDLEVTITRQANAGRPESTSHGKPGTVVLYDPDATAAKVADQARTGLSTWIRHLTGQRGLTPPALRTAPAMAIWLTHHVQAIAQDEAAGDCYDRIHELHRAIRRAIDNLAKRWAGPCTARLLVADLVIAGPGIGIGVVERECGADLRTRPGAKVIRCDMCGAEYSPVERIRWLMAKAREQQGTADFCADAFTDAGYSVTVKQIMDMRRRGRLFSYRDSDAEFDRQGRAKPLFLIGDLLDLLARDRGKVSA